MKIKWLTLFVRDIEESLRFYESLLGFEISSELDLDNRRIVFLENKSDVHLELIAIKNTKYHALVNANFSFGVQVEDLGKMVASLQAKNYHVKGPICPTPTNTFYFVNDPNGFTVQLL